MKDFTSYKTIDAQKEAPKIPGFVYAEKAVVFAGSGSALPLYEFAAPADGRPSINTMEGWNALVEKTRKDNARHRIGREPTAKDLEEQRLIEAAICAE